MQASVTSPGAGTIQRLSARRLELVKAGQVIAELNPTDSRASLDILQGELTLLRVKATAASAQNRMTLDIERLHVDWMTEKVALVLAESKQRKATLDLEMSRGMVNDPAQSKRFLQDAELAKASADAEVKERTGLVEALGSRLQELRGLAEKPSSANSDNLSKPLQALENRLHEIESNLRALEVRAPMDGMIVSVLHHEGENVKEGEPLVLISATQPKNIIGYLRQPLPLEPKVGQEVEVRTHGRLRQHGMAMITQVGAQYEAITNPMLHPATTPEVGLPVQISLPTNLKLRPGEMVSLVIKPSLPN